MSLELLHFFYILVMPKTKATALAATSKKPRTTKKPATKIARLSKKTKSVLVDVIEDEPLLAEAAIRPESFFQVRATSHEDNQEIDSQKKFFSDLVSEIKAKGEDPAKKEKNSKSDKSARSLGLYRRLVIKFVILVVILAAAVAYFSFSQLTINLSLKGEAVNDNLLLKVTNTASAQSTSTPQVSDQTDPREVIGGEIKAVTTNVSRSYAASGETYLGEEVVGKVRLINDYNKNQALVATTRILSQDGKLFRLKNAVNVPAGGEVSVDIYADKPAADLAIEPTTFTIPGLWLGLQDKIYAKSDEKFIYTQKVKKYVNVSDLERATKDITDVLLKTAKEQAGAGLAAGNNWLYLAGDSPTVKIDAKNGSQQAEFTAQASGRIIAVYFSKDQAAKLAAAKLNLLIPDDKELLEFKPENISYSLEDYDAASDSATVKAVFNGVMILKGDSEVINPKQLVNLTADQIVTYLKSRPEIKDYTLNFSPGFLKKAPSLADRIKIIINKN